MKVPWVVRTPMGAVSTALRTTMGDAAFKRMQKGETAPQKVIEKGLKESSALRKRLASSLRKLTAGYAATD